LVVESILETQKMLAKNQEILAETLRENNRLLESLLPKPFDYSADSVNEYDPESELEEVNLYETVEYDPEEDIEEVVNGEVFDNVLIQ